MFIRDYIQPLTKAGKKSDTISKDKVKELFFDTYDYKGTKP